MRYGSVCSGIEAATVAWHSLGFEPAWFSEIDAVPSIILNHHYPNVTNLGDMTSIAAKIKIDQVEAPDILVGGTPCQAFSVAGSRLSLNDDRGQLTLKFIELLDAIDDKRRMQDKEPCVAVWENVPGVLNTKDNAFGCFLGALSGSGCELYPSGRKWPNAGCVFGPQRQVAWRVLDAQHFGLAQRRKRVFVVASARAESIIEILFERKGLYGDSTESSGQRKDTTRNREVYAHRASTTISGKTCTPPILASHGQKKWLGNQEAFCGDYYIKHAIGVGGMRANAAISNEIYPTLMANHDRGYLINAYCIQNNTINQLFNGSGGSGCSKNISYTLTTGKRHAVVYCGTQNDYLRDLTCNISPTLRSGGKGGGHIKQAIFYFIPPYIFYLARYLTEIECERLQGFPDNYTKVPMVSMSGRYKTLGNSMAVNVMRWIGIRIKQYFNLELSSSKPLHPVQSKKLHSYLVEALI